MNQTPRGAWAWAADNDALGLSCATCGSGRDDHP